MARPEPLHEVYPFAGLESSTQASRQLPTLMMFAQKSVPWADGYPEAQTR